MGKLREGVGEKGVEGRGQGKLSQGWVDKRKLTTGVG